MRTINFTASILAFTCFLSSIANRSNAQPSDCVFRDTLFSINFGAGQFVQDFNLSSLKNYKRDYTTCPQDGYYSYTSVTSNCFNDDWITLTEDHTPGDVDGKMMLVNASESASGFFIATLAGFKPATDYEFAVWMLNVCKINSGCQPLPPDIFITLETPSGKRLAEFHTGKLAQSDHPAWKRYFGLFTSPPDVTSLILKMTNTTNGGCGNDFAMDDITVRQCYPPPPITTAKQEPAPSPVIETKPVPRASKPAIKETVPDDPKPFKKNDRPVDRRPVKDTVVPKLISRPKPLAAAIPMPMPLLTRENPLIKQIETGEGEILVELYDNGEIDGDTVSIYHNNELIVSRKGLSEKPISFKIKVDPSQPYHEIIMVANNLGSIPPNTSLMVVTANGKRYEIFISSSEQKNAKVIIRKKD